MNKLDQNTLDTRNYNKQLYLKYFTATHKINVLSDLKQKDYKKAYSAYKTEAPVVFNKDGSTSELPSYIKYTFLLNCFKNQIILDKHDWQCLLDSTKQVQLLDNQFEAVLSIDNSIHNAFSYMSEDIDDPYMSGNGNIIINHDLFKNIINVSLNKNNIGSFRFIINKASYTGLDFELPILFDASLIHKLDTQDGKLKNVLKNLKKFDNVVDQLKKETSHSDSVYSLIVSNAIAHIYPKYGHLKSFKLINKYLNQYGIWSIYKHLKHYEKDKLYSLPENIYGIAKAKEYLNYVEYDKDKFEHLVSKIKEIPDALVKVETFRDLGQIIDFNIKDSYKFKKEILDLMIQCLNEPGVTSTMLIPLADYAASLMDDIVRNYILVKMDEDHESLKHVYAHIASSFETLKPFVTNKTISKVMVVTVERALQYFNKEATEKNAETMILDLYATQKDEYVQVLKLAKNLDLSMEDSIAMMDSTKQISTDATSTIEFI